MAKNRCLNIQGWCAIKTHIRDGQFKHNLVDKDIYNHLKKVNGWIPHTRNCLTKIKHNSLTLNLVRIHT